MKREDPNQMIHTLHFIAVVIHFWPCDKIRICFFLLLISKKTSWQRGMCSWRASNTRSWFGSITLFRLQRSFTLSLTMSTEERYEHKHQGLRWAERRLCMWYKHCNIFCCLLVSLLSSVAVLSSAERTMLFWAQSEVLHGRGSERHRLSSLSQHCLQVRQTTWCGPVPVCKIERTWRHRFLLLMLCDRDLKPENILLDSQVDQLTPPGFWSLLLWFCCITSCLFAFDAFRAMWCSQISACAKKVLSQRGPPRLSVGLQRWVDCGSVQKDSWFTLQFCTTLGCASLSTVFGPGGSS